MLPSQFTPFITRFSGTEIPFFGYSSRLAQIGLREQSDQWGFYFTTAVFMSQSLQPMRKAYWLQKYIHETDPDHKIAYASRGNLSTADMNASQVFLKHYRAVPRRWAVLPLTFAVFEFSKGLYSRFQGKHK